MNEVPEPGSQLAGRLTTQLKRALLKLERLHEEALAPYGLRVRDLALLIFLAGRAPESQQQAALHLGVDRTSMVALIDGLEAQGLVVRRPDADDRRRNVVAVTDTGREVLAGALRASDQAERQLLAALDDDEATRLRALLRRVTARPSSS